MEGEGVGQAGPPPVLRTAKAPPAPVARGRGSAPTFMPPQLPPQHPPPFALTHTHRAPGLHPVARAPSFVPLQVPRPSFVQQQPHPAPHHTAFARPAAHRRVLPQPTGAIPAPPRETPPGPVGELPLFVRQGFPEAARYYQRTGLLPAACDSRVMRSLCQTYRSTGKDALLWCSDGVEAQLLRWAEDHREEEETRTALEDLGEQVAAMAKRKANSSDPKMTALLQRHEFGHLDSALAARGLTFKTLGAVRGDDLDAVGLVDEGERARFRAAVQMARKRSRSLSASSGSESSSSASSSPRKRRKRLVAVACGRATPDMPRAAPVRPSHGHGRGASGRRR